MNISLLRLGHRIFRDQRISSHVFLTARAFGVKQGWYTGQKDLSLEGSLSRIADQWGGSFSLKHEEKYQHVLKKGKGKVVHLTAYGLPFKKHIKTIRKEKNLLIVVGGEKVPSEIYQKADWNLSVSSQPISEVSALGIFLYELLGVFQSFPGAQLKIIPEAKGKNVISLGKKQ